MSELTQGRNAVVVAHSYGGMVGNSAVRGLTQPKLRKCGMPFLTGRILGWDFSDLLGLKRMLGGR